MALALASTPSLAQDVAVPAAPPEPAIVVPDVPAAAAPEPTVFVPAEQVQPVPAPEPSAEAAAPEPAAAAPARTRTTAPATERVTAAAPTEARAAPPEPANDRPAATLAPTVAPVAAPEPVAVDQVDPAERTAPADIGILALALGGLAFLALAIWGFVAIGRRKPVRRVVAERTAPAPIVAREPAPTAIEPVVAAPAPAAQPVRTVEPLFTPRQPAPAGGLPHAGAAVALPRELPESYEEREELFKRMVDARPDRANPFTDRKARMKRARLIMQSIGRDFGDAEPWIDLSQYPNNWPELAHKRSAAA